MKKKILAMMLSLTMVLNTFSVAGAAEFEFTDGEVTEEVELEEAALEEQIPEEAELFDDGAVVVEDNEVTVAEVEKPSEDAVQIGDSVWVDITLVDTDEYTAPIYEATISGSGDMWNYLSDGFDNNDASHKNPFKQKNFTKVVINEGVTNIGDWLFSNCGIQDMIISNTVTSIGNYSFKGTSFNCDVVLPESVVELGEHVFELCEFWNGSNRIIHHGLIEIIPDYAFSYSDVRFFDLKGVKVIGGNAFAGTNISNVEFTNGLIKIGHEAFRNCKEIESVMIPDTVEEIEWNAFTKCESLSTVVLPNNEVNLQETFTECISIQSIIVPEKIKVLLDTFYGCSRLLEVSFSGKKTAIYKESDPFLNCVRLKCIKGYDCSYAKKYADEKGIDFISLGEGQHEWSEDKIVDKQPTCTEVGSKSNHCVICGEKRNEEAIAAVGHDWGNAVIIKEPTESEEGLKRSTCRNCSEIKDEIILPVGQSTPIKVGDNVRATINGGILTLSGTGSTWDIVEWLPFEKKKHINKIVVQEGITRIGKEILVDFSAVTSVELPSSLQTIGWGAFYGADSLKEMILPEGLISLSDSALEGCDSLERISFPSSLKKIPMLSNMGYLTKLQTIIIPEGIEVIGDLAFNGCSSLEKIELPSTIVSIGESAFRDTAIKEFKWPENINIIPEYVFNGCANLEKVELPSNITAIGDYAFTGTAIKEFIWPEFIKVIQSGVFENCVNLKEFSIPEGVADINDRAFSGCTNLKKISIPKSVTFFGNDVFYNCRNLIIYGYKDSMADKYANSNNIPFIAADCKVVFKNNGRTVKTEYIIKGENATPPELTKEGYTLSWDADYTDIQEDMVINAVWTKNEQVTPTPTPEPPIIIYPPEETKYTVTFKDRGKTIKTEKVKSGEAADLPYIYRYGYELTWDKDFSKVTSNMTVNAVWTLLKPAKVTNLTAEVSAKTISLSWDEADYGGYYKVYRKAIEDEGYRLIAKTSGLLWNDRRAYNGIEYQYKVIAARSVEGKIYEGPDSDIVTAKRGVPEVGRIYTVGKLNYKVMDNSQVRVTGLAKSTASLYIPSAISICGKSFKVTSIDHKAFYKNADLIDVRMGNYITYVGQYSFYRCPNLESVRFGKNVQTISTCAFTQCPKLGNIVLPERVKRLGAKVFYHCPNLKILTIKSNYLEYIGNKALAIDRSTVIQVPSRKYSTYKKMIEKSVKFSATKIVKF